MMAPAEVGAALSAMTRPEAKILQEAVGHAETLTASVLAPLERAAGGVLLTLPDECLVFYGLHVLAAARKSEVCRPLVRFLYRPEVEVDRLFGGDPIEIIPALVISVFDGDPDPLIAAIEDPKVCEMARGALLSAVTRLCFDGAVPRETVRQLLLRLDDKPLIEPDSIAWSDWQDAVATLGFSDLADRVRASWEDERHFVSKEEREDWEELLARAINDPTDEALFATGGLAPIDDPAAALEGLGPLGNSAFAEPEGDPLARAALGAEELGWLDYFLCSPKVPGDALGLEETDGLFTALISGPVPTDLNEALAMVWDGAGEEPAFDDAEQAQYVRGQLTRHWNLIGVRLARNVPLQPLIPEFDDFGGEELGQASGRGFIRGMLLHFEEWRPLLDDKKEGVNLMPIFALGKAPAADDAEGEEAAGIAAAEWIDEAEWEEADESVFELEELDGPEEDVAEEDEAVDWMEDEDWDDEAKDDAKELDEAWLGPEMRVELATGLPFCVSRIHRFWRRRAGPSAMPPAGPRKIGRNEPCPCGSGKKYKRCCGA